MLQQKTPLECRDYVMKWINNLHTDHVEEIISKRNVY